MGLEPWTVRSPVDALTHSATAPPIHRVSKARRTTYMETIDTVGCLSSHISSRNYSCYNIMNIKAKSPPSFVDFQQRDVIGILPLATRSRFGIDGVRPKSARATNSCVYFSWIGLLERRIYIGKSLVYIVIIENFAKIVRNWVLCFYDPSWPTGLIISLINLTVVFPRLAALKQNCVSLMF